MELKQHKTFSPKQVGRAIGVSEASIKRWCDKGILSFSKTAGGHRRLRLHAILDFLKENDFELVLPEVLGLPATVGSGPRAIDQACQLFIHALEQGNEDQCLGVALDMHCMTWYQSRIDSSAGTLLKWQLGRNPARRHGARVRGRQPAVAGERAVLREGR